MGRNKNRTINGQSTTGNNGNGKAPNRRPDSYDKKPRGYGKGYTKDNPQKRAKAAEKKPSDPKSFQKGMSKNSAAFFEKMFKHRNRQEGFLEGPNFP